MHDRQVYERVLAESCRCGGRLEELRTFIRVYEEFAGMTPASPPNGWQALAAKILLNTGRPMRVVELYRAMATEGFSVDSAKPADVLATRLGRNPAFRRVKRGTYALVQDDVLAHSRETGQSA